MENAKKLGMVALVVLALVGTFLLASEGYADLAFLHRARVNSERVQELKAIQDAQRPQAPVKVPVPVPVPPPADK